MQAWDRESLETALQSNNWGYRARDIDYGVQFELDQGVKVNLYQTGRITFGGPKSSFKSQVEEQLQSRTPKSPAESAPSPTDQFPFRSKVAEAANTLGAALASAGFEIDVRDLLGGS